MYRIFVGWNNGSFVNSLDEDFQKDLNVLIKDFGLPNTVEVRSEKDQEFVKIE